VATKQHAHLLVRRASVSLGRLLRQINRDVEGRQRVSAAAGEILQGLALPDVVEAWRFLADRREEAFRR
jgi:hypothetical protein